MSAYQRSYPLFSLCGLNCGLCPNYHSSGASRCGGCGGENFFNASCGIMSCAARHGRLEYCFQCDEYPCARYAGADEADSFITHLHQLADNAKAAQLGLDAYCRQLEDKMALLDYLLANYNDGRRKSLFCLAANLLEAEDLRQTVERIKERTQAEDTLKQRAALAAQLLTEQAGQRGISLKLRKK